MAEIRKIQEGMTGAEVADLLDGNFRGLDSDIQKNAVAVNTLNGVLQGVQKTLGTATTDISELELWASETVPGTYATKEALKDYLALAGDAQMVRGTVYFDGAYFNNVPFADVGSKSVRMATMDDLPGFTPLLDEGVEIARVDIGGQQVFLYAPKAASVDLTNYYTKDEIAKVALTGSYNDLIDKPAIPSVVDSLVSEAVADALSAKQGKVLNDAVGALRAALTLVENSYLDKTNPTVTGNMTVSGLLSAGSLSVGGRAIGSAAFYGVGNTVASGNYELITGGGVHTALQGYATTGALAGYLPTIGGTLTGALRVESMLTVTGVSEIAMLSCPKGLVVGDDQESGQAFKSFTNMFGWNGDGADLTEDWTWMIGKDGRATFGLLNATNLTLADGGVKYAGVYHDDSWGVYLWNEAANAGLGLTDDGIPHVNGLSLLYVGNYDLYLDRVYAKKATTLAGYGITDGVNAYSKNLKAGTSTTYDSIFDYLPTVQSLLGGLYTDQWWHVISARHNNGVSDGNNYGLVLYSDFFTATSYDGGGLYWAKQMSGNWYMKNLILDSSNYSFYALPLSGGTITINSYQGITIKRDATNTGGLLWFANNSGNLGAIGFSANKECYIDTGSTEHTIIHSGNIANYALSLNGGGRINLEYGTTSVDIKDWGVNINVAANGGWDRSYGIGNEPYENSYIRFGAYGEAGNNLMAYISVGAQDYNSATLKVYPTYATILDNTIIHSGNIGSQSVASAKILVDENGSYMVYKTSAGRLYVGDNIYPSGDTHILGKNIWFRYGTDASYGLGLNSSGNVTIGSSDLATTNYKLYVNGNSYVNGSITCKSTYIAEDIARFSRSGYAGISFQGISETEMRIMTTDKNGSWSANNFIVFSDGSVYLGGRNATTLYVKEDSIEANKGINIYGTLTGYVSGTDSDTWSITNQGAASFNSLTVNGATAATQSWVKEQGYLANGISSFKVGTYDGLNVAGTYLGTGSIVVKESAPSIKFLVKNYTADYTSIIEEATANVLNINEQVYIKNGGNVAIGTSTINNSYKLYVNGATYFKGNSYVNGTLTSTGEGTFKGARIGDGNLTGGYDGSTIWSISAEGVASFKSLTVNGVAVTGTLSIGSTRLNVGSTTLHGDVSLEYGALTLTHGNIGSSYWSITNDGAATVRTLSQTSDITKKNVISDIRLSLGTMANAPLIKFTWADGLDSRLHVGTIAQYWEDALPEVVSTTPNDTLALAYGELGVAMGISLAKEVQELTEEVQRLRDENRALAQRLNNAGVA